MVVIPLNLRHDVLNDYSMATLSVELVLVSLSFLLFMLLYSQFQLDSLSTNQNIIFLIFTVFRFTGDDPSCGRL